MTHRTTAAVALLASCGCALAQPIYRPLAMDVNGLSADGQIAVGRTGGRACYWSAATNQIVVLGVPEGMAHSEATCISADGTVIAGTSSNSSSPPFGGWVWTASGGFVTISVPGSLSLQVSCISEDGNVVGGAATPPSGFYQGFVWSQAEGGRMIPGGPNYSTWLHALSWDGNVGVGSGSSGAGPWAMLWPSTHLWCVNLGLVPGSQGAFMIGMTPDASTCVGYSYNPSHALVWHDGVLERFDPPVGFTGSRLNAVSADGRVAGGRLMGGGTSDPAAVWRKGAGLMTLKSYAQARGVVFPSSTSLYEVSAMSENGRVFAGITSSFTSGYIIDLGRCGSADFNHDGDTGTDQDINAFFACLAGNCCPQCDSADFNDDGDFGTDQDIEAFFRVLSGAAC